VAVVDAAGAVRLHTVTVRGDRTPFVLPVVGGVRDVLLDPEFTVPRWTPALREEADATAAGTVAYVELLFRGEPATARGTLERALVAVRDPDVYAARFIFNALLGTLAFQSGDAETARARFTAALSEPTRHAETLPWTYVRLALAERQLGRPEAARTAARAAVAADRVVGRRTGATAAAVAAFPDATGEPAARHRIPGGATPTEPRGAP
jgi:Tfp pilus assembly protein PilF